MSLILLINGPMPTTAAQAVVSTGTAIKTLLQFKASATLAARIVEWGVSFDGAAAGAGIKCELLETDVAATVTAFAAADLHKLDEAALICGDLTTNLIQVGTTASGYTASGEGSITTIRQFDAQLVAPSGGYVKQFPLGMRPAVQAGKFGRIRVTAAAAVNAYAYMVIEI